MSTNVVQVDRSKSIGARIRRLISRTFNGREEPTKRLPTPEQMEALRQKFAKGKS